MLLEFEIGGQPAELEVTWRGERRLALAGRTLFRARAWQRARWLVRVGDHAATVVTHFWPWPSHRVVVDGVPHPGALALSGLTRLPLLIVLLAQLASLMWGTPGVVLIHALQHGPRFGGAAAVFQSFDGADLIHPGVPGPDAIAALRIYAGLFGRGRDSELAIATTYALNHQVDEAERLVVDALAQPPTSVTKADCQFVLQALSVGLLGEGGCVGFEAILEKERIALGWAEADRRLAGCRREPLGLRSIEEPEFPFDSDVLSRLRSALWNHQDDIAVELARRAEACPGWRRTTSAKLRWVAYARAGLREDADDALSALLCRQPCSERLLRNDPLTAPLLDDPATLARVRAACTRPELPPYPGLVRG